MLLGLLEPEPEPELEPEPAAEAEPRKAGLPSGATTPFPDDLVGGDRGRFLRKKKKSWGYILTRVHTDQYCDSRQKLHNFKLNKSIKHLLSSNEDTTVREPLSHCLTPMISLELFCIFFLKNIIIYYIIILYSIVCIKT